LCVDDNKRNSLFSLLKIVDCWFITHTLIENGWV
jgi:hypothetical protein